MQERDQNIEEEQREDSGRKGEKQKNCIYFKEKPIVISALIHL